MKFWWIIAVLGLSACGTVNLDAFSGDVPDAPQVALATGTDTPSSDGDSSWLSMFRSAPAEDESSVDDAPLEFGQIAKVCSFSNRDLGTQVVSQAGFKLFDTNPKLLAPRTHYITGFRDRCARRFTAGLVVFGDPALHEVRRYRTTAEFTVVDTAYETIKNRVCRVSTGQPCGDRIDRLTRDTTFVSLYRTFGAVKPGGTLLLHRGRLDESSF